uniref:Uncharacterized protein n=1 Tax=Anguilla anguilla TaxID=7936 RepID=A0A0E9RPJ1_ANGAN
MLRSEWECARSHTVWDRDRQSVNGVTECSTVGKELGL